MMHTSLLWQMFMDFISFITVFTCLMEANDHMRSNNYLHSFLFSKATNMAV